MTYSQAAIKAKNRVEEALRRAAEEVPALANIYEGFGELLAETAAFKADLGALAQEDVPPVDLDRFRQGVPVAGKQAVRISPDELGAACQRLILPMQRGFPKIKEELGLLWSRLEQPADQALHSHGDPHGPAMIQAVLKGNAEQIGVTASALKIAPEVLVFAVNRLVMPFAERMAEGYALPGDAGPRSAIAAGKIPAPPRGPSSEGVEWLRGYCPICGSWPNLSLIKGNEGHRWLRCSFCSCEWRFARIACPFCQTDDHDKIEIIYSDARPFERVELCHNCGHYLAGIDTRECAAPPVLEVSALVLVYLEIMAQERGFQPGTLESPPYK